MLLRVLLGLELLACYWSTITDSLRFLISTGDITRAIFPPAIAVYWIWTRRQKLRDTAVEPAPAGLALLLAGAVLSYAGVVGGSLTLIRFAFLVSLGGCIVVAWGFRMLRTLAIPFTLLSFALPIPSPVYFKLAAPLQAIASSAAALILSHIGFHAVRSENVIYLPSQILVISQECSGIQSLVTLLFFCFVYSYWNESRTWMRTALVAAAIPASVLANIARISVTGLIGEFNHKYTQDAWHAALGYIVFTAEFCLIWGGHRLVALKFEEEAAASALAAGAAHVGARARSSEVRSEVTE